MSESGKLMRISVAVDEETRSIIEELAKKEDKTISDIIRHSIMFYSKLKDRNLSPETAEEYLDIVPTWDNIIIDIELWLTILDELNECTSEDFWKTIKKIGYKHGFEFRSRGINDIKEILRSLELKHLFEMKETNGNGYTLILTTRSEVKLLKEYIQGIFESAGIDVEIVEGIRKLIIVSKDAKLKS